MASLPDIRLGPVSLTISDMARSLAFYCERLGMQLHRQEGDRAYLGAGQEDLLILNEIKGARLAGRSTGLYHFALLVPSRLELARSLRRIAETSTPVQGFADHLVSEAIYLPDPDGNGIEIYRDRPRHKWPRLGGKLQMGTEALNVDAVLAELDADDHPWEGLSAATILGHIHLHVSDLNAAERFYTEVVGFDGMFKMANSASFLSAAGYHHHLGINTWAGVGAPAPPPDAIGLRWWALELPDQQALSALEDRIRARHVPVEYIEGALCLSDPSDNRLRLTLKKE